MLIRRDRNPFERAVPTDGSLAFAAQISALLDIPFDRDEVEALSRELFETMFSDLVSVLQIDPDSVRFESGYFFATRAFALPRKDGTPQINIDTTFDYWISTLCLLASVATFEVPGPARWTDLLEQVDATFHLFDDAKRYARARDGMTPFLTDFHHLLNLSEGLSRAMLVFVLCHELAHCQLGHMNAQEDKHTELDADRLAAQLFLRVVAFGAQNNDTTIHIDPKVAGAPIIFMYLLALYEAWLARQGRDFADTSRHPNARDRLECIEPILLPELSEVACNVIDGLKAGIDDIKSTIAA